MKICISAGHSKDVRGAAGPSPWGLDEVNEARRVTKRVGELLNAGGVETKTYWDDVSQSQNENLGRICDWHNSQPQHDIDCSIHFNAYQVTTTKPMGVEVFYGSDQALAKRICDAIVSACGLPNRGAKDGSGLYFIAHTAKPAVLVETCFVDAKIDADTFRRAFEPMCLGIAEGLAGRKLGSEPEPPPEEERPPWIEPPATDARRTIAKGDNGADVAELQRALGVLIVDGDYGSISETWVKAFQGACGLSRDGVCGPQTWAQVDLLTARLKDGEPPLPKALADQIYTMAQTSEIAEFNWPGRGVAPPGYVPGMALCFAVALRRAEAGDAAAKVMSKELGSPDTDALAWCKPELASKGLTFGTWDARLRALFTLQTGLGPRESSGRYFEGRDMSASNVESETCEAGLTQTSWNIRNGSSSIPPLLPQFWKNPNGFLDVFKEGLAPTSNNLDSYGSGDGLRYQFLSRFAPLFHVLVTATGLRVLRAHWGPVVGHEVTIKKEVDDLLKDVQTLVEDTPQA